LTRVDPDVAGQDRILAEKAAGGDVSAFEMLVVRHQDRIFGVVHRLVGDPEMARDLTQETFLKAWRGISGFQGRSGFYTWLYRIARNAVTSAGRYQSARPQVSASLGAASSEDGPSGVEPADPREGPEARSLRDEQRRLVLDAIADLPAEFREIVVLRDMDDRSYEEIAELLDIATGTVRSRLHRARMELKERLRKVLHPAGRPGETS
jgi:RNA polymerase sigma-70 factor (ECF subfamily)